MPADSLMRLHAWLRLDAVPGIGPVRAQRLLQAGSIVELAGMDAADLRQLGLDESQIHAFLHPDSGRLAQVFAWLEAPAHHLLTQDDPRYPARITSYNVCYTKLLRIRSAGAGSR